MTSERPWGNKPTELCYLGHKKDGLKTQKYTNKDGTVRVYEQRYCKTCSRASMRRVADGFVNVRVSKFLYRDVTAGAKTRKISVHEETQRLIALALRVERRNGSGHRVRGCPEAALVREMVNDHKFAYCNGENRGGPACGVCFLCRMRAIVGRTDT